MIVIRVAIWGAEVTKRPMSINAKPTLTSLDF